MSAKSSSRIDQADIDRANAVSLTDIARERRLILKKGVGPCPRCGGDDRFSINNGKGLYNCRGCGDDEVSEGVKGRGRGAISFVRWLDGVGFREAVATLIGERPAPVKSAKFSDLPAKKTAADAEYEREQSRKARWLWSQRRPITGTAAKVYVRQARGIACPLPPTLAFLPPTKPGHHPAMISAFGLCDEIEPGTIAAPSEIVAVHLTLLKPDGSGKAEVEPDKIIIGSPSVEIQRGDKTEKIGRPIIVAPPNDLLGLAICEGIEDALSVYQALGLGAWAAGAAGFMPKLADAVPDWIDCVSIFADADADQQGERNAAKLAERLNDRGIFAEVLSLAEVLGS